MRTFLLAAALLCAMLHGQQLYFGAIGGTALTRDFPVFESTYLGDTFGNPPSDLLHFSGPKSLILGGLVGVRLHGPFSLELNVLHRPWRNEQTYTEYPPGAPSRTFHYSFVAANAWEFPLMLKWDLPAISERHLRPFVEGGVAIRTAQNVSGVQLSPVGATIGAGIGFHLRSIRIAPTLRYSRWEGKTHFPPYPSRADQIEFLTSIALGTEEGSWHISNHRMGLGLVGGLALTPEFQSHYSYAPYDAIREKTRYVAGAAVEVDLHHSLALEVDGMYKPLRTGSDSTDRFSVVTWQFPVLTKHRWNRQRYTAFAEVGPSFRIAGNLNGYNPSHYGVTGGGGVEVAAGALHVSPMLRYTRWARDSYRSYGYSPPNGGTSRNALELLFAFTF